MTLSDRNLLFTVVNKEASTLFYNCLVEIQLSVKGIVTLTIFFLHIIEPFLSGNSVASDFSGMFLDGGGGEAIKSS